MGLKYLDNIRNMTNNTFTHKLLLLNYQLDSISPVMARIDPNASESFTRSIFPEISKEV